MNNIETLKRWLVALEDAASCVQKNYLPDQMGNDWDAEIEEMRQAIEQAQQVEPEQLAKLGWQAIDCPICGGGARAFPKHEQAQPVGEVLNERGEVDWISFVPSAGTHLYTAPPPRQPLTDEQIRELTGNAGTLMQEYAIKVARAIEAKLKEKNT